MAETRQDTHRPDQVLDRPSGWRLVGGRRWLVVAIGVTGLLVSVTIWRGLVARERGLMETQFRFDAEVRIRSIEREFRRDAGVIYFLSAFYAGSEYVSRDEFHTVTERLLSRSRHLQALEWIPRVIEEERGTHEASAWDDHLREYQISERGAAGGLVRAAAREEYFPVYYVEPAEGNLNALGFDLATEPVAREAMTRARERGQVTASGRISLAPEASERVGVRMFGPIWHEGAVSDPSQEPQPALLGFVSIVVRLDSLVEDALDYLAPVGIDIQIFDESAVPGQRALLCRASKNRHAPFVPSEDPQAEAPIGMHHAVVLEVPGRQWSIHCTPTDVYAGLPKTWPVPPIGSLALGVVITFLVTMYVSALAGRAARVEQLVVERAADLQRANESLETEIGERKRTEAGLRDSQALYSSLVENLPVHVLRKDLEGRFTFANESFCELLGKGLSEIEGKTDFDLYPRDLARKYRNDDQRVADTGKLFECVEENKKGDQTRYVQVMKSPVRDASGQIVGVQVIFWDVTARRQAEAALEQERYHLHALMDNVPHNIYFKDRESRFIRINKALAGCFGLRNASEAIGKSDFHFFSEEHARQAREDEQQVMSTGRPILDKEEKETWLDGRETWANTTKLPLYNEQGEIVGTFGISRDITEQKLAAEALRAAKEAAESANRAKSVFLANMSHEIRTPMNVIIGMTELVLDTQLSREQREYLMAVQESSEALLSLINDVLDFSKIEAGRLDLDSTVFDLHDTLGDTMRWLAIRAHGKGLELACQIRPEVPVAVIGDRNRLRQVVVNLLGNAIKFTDHGEVVMEVSCQGQSDHQVALHFAVTDTGIGIPDDKLRVIFDVFEQADTTTTRRFGGTGLGLAISSKLVELMGGRIWAESQLGEGSTFHFTAQFGTAREEEAVAPAVQRGILRGTRALVVDDNATNRLILEEVLKNWEMQPACASGVEEAFELMRAAQREKAPFPLVITDVHMPGQDGFDLVARIKEDGAMGSTIIMMLTSGDQPGDIARCEEMGVAAYLLKPVKQSELLDAVMMALGVASAEEEGAQASVQERPRRTRPLRVLLAEDSLVNQKLAIGLLEKRGHSVVVASNGKEAIAALELQRFDLVIMDVQMPEMDGLEATAVIRARERKMGGHLPIVAMTAHAMKGDRERCLEAGMDRYVSKPIRTRELYDAIESLVGTPADSRTEPQPPAPEGEDLDWDEAIRALKGDRDLLKVVVEAALEECPRLLEDVRRAVAAADPAALRAAAHTLKGSIRYFGDTRAYQLAFRLEEMGRDADLNGAEATLTALEGEMVRLTPILLEYGRRHSAAKDS